MTESHRPARSSEAKPRLRLSKSTKQWLIYGSLGIAALLFVVFLGPMVSSPIEDVISVVENQYQKWFSQQDTANPMVLLPLAFLGGVLASVSPCILGLLPVNLSYIGTLEIKSKWDAFTKAGAFVLGAVVILSLFGLVSSFAGAVMVEYRGYINVVVGLIMVVMGLWLVGVVRIPLPTFNIGAPAAAGPFGVGLTFALVSSPCASPVLFAVLAAAAASGSQLLGTLTMVSYALGYTILIFLASLFTGLAKQSRNLLKHAEGIIRFGSVALLLTGGYYVVTGTQWFFAG